MTFWSLMERHCSGADDKAGCAIIMETLEQLIQSVQAAWKSHGGLYPG